jgi:hypothetical protein
MCVCTCVFMYVSACIYGYSVAIGCLDGQSCEAPVCVCVCVCMCVFMYVHACIVVSVLRSDASMKREL